MVTFSKKEVIHLLIAALVLGLLFGYDDCQSTFNLSFWITNLIITILLCFISITIYDVGHKIVAKKLGCRSTFEIWGVKRLSLRTSGYIHSSKRSVPFGVIITLLMLYLTKGTGK